MGWHEHGGRLYTSRELFAEGADAAEEIVRVMKARLNPLDRADFITLTNQLHRLLQLKALPPERKVVEYAIQKLDLDWNSLSPAQQSAAIDVFNQALSGLVPARMTAHPLLTAEAPKIVAATKEATVQRFNLNIDQSWSRADEAVARSVASMHANFITDASGAIVQSTTLWARKTVSEMAEAGYGSSEIANRLAAGASAQTLGKASNYWRVVSTAFVGRARTQEQLAAYAEAQIDYYVWESVLDERTTEVCRFMHGQRFTTQESIQRSRAAEAAGQARGAVGVKDTQPWATNTRLEDGRQAIVARTSDGSQRVIAIVDEPGYGAVDRIGKYSAQLDAPTLESLGLSTPPVHGMCRSTIVADV